MTTSILDDTKKFLGITADQTVFDDQILLLINGVLANLAQLGIGPEEGVYIEDASTTWDAVLGTDNRRNMARTYLTGKVKLSFDSPQTSYHVESLKQIVAEAEWRLSVAREEVEWTDPDPEV